MDKKKGAVVFLFGFVSFLFYQDDPKKNTKKLGRAKLGKRALRATSRVSGKKKKKKKKRKKKKKKKKKNKKKRKKKKKKRKKKKKKRKRKKTTTKNNALTR